MTDTTIPRTIKTGVTGESKFRAILLIARRAMQIQGGARLLINTTEGKATRIAREEFEAGVLRYEIIPLG